MAWTATDYISSHPDSVLVIIVGEFHVQFGGGLKDRLKARLPRVQVLTFSQIITTDLTDEQVAAEIQPSIKYGPRADYLWVN